MEQTAIREVTLIKKYRMPTKEADDLRNALEERGVRVFLEYHDGYKHIDLALPGAKINVEVDGIQHLTDPKQILADLHRGYYSHKRGYNTMHIPNEMIRSHLYEISNALAEASKMKERILSVQVE